MSNNPQHHKDTKSFEGLSSDIIEWHYKRGILKMLAPLGAGVLTDHQRALYLMSGNLAMAIELYIKDRGWETQNNLENCIGGMLTAIIVNCHLHKINPIECLNKNLNCAIEFVKDTENTDSINIELQHEAKKTLDNEREKDQNVYG